ncbi:MAG: AMP-dependent synthetase/ligase [Anaerovoracaceae bacterium]|jgi:long-chain acyl-CoA synthetase
MNNRKYKDALYDPRPLRDLRDLIKSSRRLYGSKPAFLVKKDHEQPFQPISYIRWDAEVDAMGTAFCNLGLKGKKIAVTGENSYKWVVSYMATTNGTGVIVPIDRELKPLEIANLLNRAEVSAIVHSQKMKKVIKKVLPLLDKPLEVVINMDAEDDDEDGTLSWDRLLEKGKEAVAAGDRTFIDAEIDPERMCSLLFTSGTTGMAKGVMLSHKSIASNVYATAKYVDVLDYVGLSVLPMHHSYEMSCHIFMGLFMGFTCAICEGLRYIIKNMQEAHVSIMLAVPLIYENMHKKIMQNAKKTGQYKKLRMMIAISKKLKLYNNQKLIRKLFKPIHELTGNHIIQFIAGGAAMDPKVAEDFEAMGFPFIQGYGMTENSPIISVNRDRYAKQTSAGQPLVGTEVKVIDQDEDGIGEICLRGPSIMIGYYDDPEETAKVLTEDGWLKTGDYGYLDDEGYIYISGRKKNVIITKNGKNVFPEEIEFYLEQSDFIEETLVHGVPDDRGDTVIKAEVVPAYNEIEMQLGDLDEDEIHDLINEEIDKANELMPLYKKVRRFAIRKEEFTKTTTRKIKRHTAENMNNDRGEDVK